MPLFYRARYVGILRVARSVGIIEVILTWIASCTMLSEKSKRVFAESWVPGLSLLKADRLMDLPGPLWEHTDSHATLPRVS